MSLTKSELVAALAEANDITKVQADGVLKTLVDIVYREVKKGNDILVPGIAKISVAKRAARNGRNPSTGEAMKIPARKVVRYTAPKAIKDVAAGVKKK